MGAGKSGMTNRLESCRPEGSATALMDRFKVKIGENTTTKGRRENFVSDHLQSVNTTDIMPPTRSQCSLSQGNHELDK